MVLLLILLTITNDSVYRQKKKNATVTQEEKKKPNGGDKQNKAFVQFQVVIFGNKKKTKQTWQAELIIYLVLDSAQSDAPNMPK